MIWSKPHHKNQYHLEFSNIQTVLLFKEGYSTQTKFGTPNNVKQKLLDELNSSGDADDENTVWDENAQISNIVHSAFFIDYLDHYDPLPSVYNT